MRRFQKIIAGRGVPGGLSSSRPGCQARRSGGTGSAQQCRLQSQIAQPQRPPDRRALRLGLRALGGCCQAAPAALAASRAGDAQQTAPLARRRRPAAARVPFLRCSAAARRLTCNSYHTRACSSHRHRPRMTTCGQTCCPPPAHPSPHPFPYPAAHHPLCLPSALPRRAIHPGTRTRISNGSLSPPTGSLYASVAAAALGVP